MSHINEVAYEWVWVSIWLSPDTCEWVMSHVNASYRIWMSHKSLKISHIIREWVCHVWRSHVTYEWVVSHMSESCHARVSHTTYNESCHIWIDSCHIWMSHLTHTWMRLGSHPWTNHGRYARIVSRLKESHYISRITVTSMTFTYCFFLHTSLRGSWTIFQIYGLCCFRHRLLLREREKERDKKKESDREGKKGRERKTERQREKERERERERKRRTERTRTCCRPHSPSALHSSMWSTTTCSLTDRKSAC